MHSLLINNKAIWFDLKIFDKIDYIGTKSIIYKAQAYNIFYKIRNMRPEEAISCKETRAAQSSK